LTDSPDRLAQSGKYAAVPMIVGGQLDEGTLFALFASNVTDSDELFEYFHNLYYPTAELASLHEVIDSYSDDASAGSPYGTGIFNEIFPTFKKLASLTGDLLFTMMGRLFLNAASELNPDVPSWSYVAAYDEGTPILGTFHGGDLLQVFFGIKDNYAAASIRSYFISFVHHLDPNNSTDPEYPTWSQWKDGKQVMQFGADEAYLTSGDFRSDNYEIIAENIDSLRQ
jgi:carboxylesterase type B